LKTFLATLLNCSC